MIRHSIWLACAATLLLGACAQAPQRPTATAAVLESARPKALTLDRLILSAQPSEQDLALWRAEGVATVFNLRTPAEMADRSKLPFDEPATVRALGLSYVEQPMDGKAFPFTPDAVDALAAALQNSAGSVLLHCASGNRAGWLYAAYAVKHLGMSPDEAMRQLAPLGHWPLPLETLSGRALRVEFADTPAVTREGFEERP
jgi:uncharacterized protein (TIGR01244 family)